MSQHHETFFATCPRGLEVVLRAELEQLGARDVSDLPGGVSFTGPLALCYAVNLHSRIASRVLWRVFHGHYRDEHDIFRAAQALHADCRRDIRLGKQWGFDASGPTCVLPGNGGVRTDVFRAPAARADAPIVVNPRGARSYVRTDIFFQAIPLVQARYPEARFLCASLAGDHEALKWIGSLHIENAVQLLPHLTPLEMASLFQGAQLVVSPSVHDGTPNSLLEGMACGCLPVAGDLESIREWITPGENGLLADATDVRALAEAMIEGLGNQSLRLQAAGFNREIILQRAEYTRCMADADGFYKRVISGS
jgi:glycosyltransferase involved in cell wall biosynthesis